MKTKFIPLLQSTFWALAIGCTFAIVSCSKDTASSTSDTNALNALYSVLSVFQSEATFSRAANVWQRFQLLHGAILGGHSQPMAGFAPTTGQYSFPGTEAWEDWRDVALKYFYNQNVMPNAIKYATSASSTDLLKGIGLVLKVQAAHALTDQLGPLPYSKIAALTDTAVDFDNSETIYKKLFVELDSAQTYLNKAVADAAISSYDKIYAGDITKWKKYLNSLRLRLALRIRYVDPALAKTQGEKAIANGVFTSAAEQAVLNTKGIAREETIHEDTHPFANVVNVYASVDANICQADFASHLNGYKDPRLFQMYETVDRTTNWDNKTGLVPGVRIGLPDYLDNGYSKLSGKIQKFKGSFYDYVIISYSEVCFLLAEASLLGWAGAGTAQTNYENGIKANMAYWGVSDATAITSYIGGTTLPEAHYDYKATGQRPVPVASTDATYIQYKTDSIAYETKKVASRLAPVSTASVKFEGTNEQKLEKIIIQKWIALYPDGQEAWSEQRRTGYPKLFPSAHSNSATLDAAVGVGQRAVRRVPYALGSTMVFGKNAAIKAKANAAITNFLEGSNDFKKRMWWDVSTKTPLP